MKRDRTGIYIARWITCAVLILIILFLLTVLFHQAIDTNRQPFAPNTPAPLPSNTASMPLVSHLPGTPPPNQNTKIPFTLQLVNHSHPVDGSYSPEQLINVYEKYGTADVSLRDRFVMMNEEAYLACREMFQAAKAAGLTGMYVLSAYREFDKQAELYEDYIAQGGGSDQYPLVAKAGQSEHQTGLAMDLAVLDETAQTTNDFALTPQGQWVLAHCWDYGFVLRFPADKQDITQVSYESWHFRYVGKEHARKMKDMNLCLEEYHQYLYD